MEFAQDLVCKRTWI